MKKRPVLIYLNDEERAALQKAADEDGRSLSQEGRRLIVAGLQEAPFCKICNQG